MRFTNYMKSNKWMKMNREKYNSNEFLFAFDIRLAYKHNNFTSSLSCMRVSNSEL